MGGGGGTLRTEVGVCDGRKVDAPLVSTTRTLLLLVGMVSPTLDSDNDEHEESD